MARRTRGFTLIELMIVLVVAAVIMTIAIPAFNAQMRKSRRSEILSQMQALVLSQEQFRANNASYATLAQLGTPTATHYTIAVALNANAAIGYTITSTAKSGDDQTRDKANGTACTPLTLTSLNGTVGKSPPACWQ